MCCLISNCAVIVLTFTRKENALLSCILWLLKHVSGGVMKSSTLRRAEWGQIRVWATSHVWFRLGAVAYLVRIIACDIRWVLRLHSQATVLTRQPRPTALLCATHCETLTSLTPACISYLTHTANPHIITHYTASDVDKQCFSSIFPFYDLQNMFLLGSFLLFEETPTSFSVLCKVFFKN